MTSYLGFWQLERLKWKEQLIDNFNNLQDQKPLSLSMGKMKYPNIEEFTKIISKGTVDRSKKIFLPVSVIHISMFSNPIAGIILSNQTAKINST